MVRIGCNDALLIGGISLVILAMGKGKGIVKDILEITTVAGLGWYAYACLFDAPLGRFGLRGEALNNY